MRQPSNQIVQTLQKAYSMVISLPICINNITFWLCSVQKNLVVKIRFLLSVIFKLIILIPTFSESKSYCTIFSVHSVQYAYFSKKRTHFSHFPIILRGEGYPKNATHFNLVTVKFALNSRKIRQNLQKKTHVTTLYNVITWVS